MHFSGACPIDAYIPLRKNVIMWNRHAFTLVELLVVIAIIGASSRCCFPRYRRRVKRLVACNAPTTSDSLALAAHNYHDVVRSFPPAMLLTQYDANKACYRGASLFVLLLPYLEQGNLHDRWDFANPNANFGGGTESRATLGPNLLCPSEPENENPLHYSTRLTGSSQDRWDQSHKLWRKRGHTVVPSGVGLFDDRWHLLHGRARGVAPAQPAAHSSRRNY